MSEIVIEVTAEDIATGVRGAHCGCPIVLAVERATGCFAEIADALYLSGRTTGKVCQLEMPAEAWDFVTKFDNRRPVEPFSFRIDPAKPHPALLFPEIQGKEVPR